MFKDWDSFFLLIGGAAGGMIGLIFIVITLIRGVNATMTLRNSSVFMSPNVFHLAAVLVLSALATAPDIPAAVVGALVGAGALAGLVVAGRVVIMLGPSKAIRATHWTDIWAYGLIPAAAYVVLAAAAATAWLAPAWAARALGVSLVVLLLIAIRNAWDLVTWITAKGDQLGRPEG
jgi:hypothetical protein